MRYECELLVCLAPLLGRPFSEYWVTASAIRVVEPLKKGNSFGRFANDLMLPCRQSSCSWFGKVGISKIGSYSGLGAWRIWFAGKNLAV